MADSSEARLFLATYGAGVWVSENGGAEWEPINGTIPLPNDRTVASFHAIDFRCDTILMHSRTNDPTSRFLYSFNGGDSWSAIWASFMTPAESHLIAWHVDPNVLFYLSQNGVFARSSDWTEGNWTQFQIDDQSTKTGLYQDPVRDSTLYYTGNYLYSNGSSRGGFVRSNDLGQTWNVVINFDSLFGLDWVYVSGMARLSNGVLVVLVQYTSPDVWQNGTILLSQDDGMTWTRVYGGITDRFLPVDVIEDSQSPGTLFMIGVQRYGMYWSHDFGQTWERCLNGLPANVSICEDLHQNPYSGVLYVSILGYGVYHSMDHGESWQLLPGVPVGATGQLSFTDFSLFLCDDAYRQWQLSTTIGEWSELALPLSVDTLTYVAPIIYKQGDLLVTAVMKRPFGQPTDHLQMAYSDDGGNTWSLNPFLAFYSEFFPYTYRSDSNVFIWFSQAGDPLLHVSQNLGQDWLEIDPPTNLYNYGIVQSDTAVYLIVNDGVELSDILRSVDLGASWQQLEYPGPYLYGTRNVLALGQDLYVRTEDGTLDSQCLRWSNGEWETRGTIPDTRYFHRFFPIPLDTDTLFVGTATSGLIWKSDDLGFTWNSFHYELPLSLQNRGFAEPVYDPENQRIWVSSGVGVCYLELSALNTDRDTVYFLPADYTLLSVYPNPFNSQATILYDLDKPQHVALRVFNVEGRLVRTLADVDQEAGRHRVTLDAADLASGVYFVEIERWSGTRTQKLLLLK